MSSSVKSRHPPTLTSQDQSQVITAKIRIHFYSHFLLDSSYILLVLDFYVVFPLFFKFLLPANIGNPGVSFCSFRYQASSMCFLFFLIWDLGCFTNKIAPKCNLVAMHRPKVKLHTTFNGIKHLHRTNTTCTLI